MACARPAAPPPPAAPADGCPANSERVTGFFSVIYGDSPTGATVMRYLLTVDASRTLTLLLDEQLLASAGGATALNGKRVSAGLERAAANPSERQVCSIAPV
jgi:hypothetical protein